MAAGEDGEHTGFPCLAMVRYAVATVVTVLAAAVVVMAIHVVLRSEDVQLSIDYGYIEADRLWSVTEAYGADELPLRSKVGVTQVTQVNIQPNLGTSPGDEQAVSEAAAAAVAHTATSSAQSSSSSSSNDSTTTVPADQVNLRVILSAHNPGGRSMIDCNRATIRVLDMQNAYQEIVQFELDNFTVPQQTSHTQTKRVEVSNKTVLAYIKDQYHGVTSFSVMVQVDAIITSITSYPLGRKTNSNNQTYFCWPVTVGLIAYGTLRDTNVACKTREETQLRVGPLPLGLASTGSKAS